MPMTLPEASSVKNSAEKEQINESLTTAINNADYNGGGRSKGAINTTAKEESNENAIR